MMMMLKLLILLIIRSSFGQDVYNSLSEKGIIRETGHKKCLLDSNLLSSQYALCDNKIYRCEDVHGKFGGSCTYESDGRSWDYAYYGKFKHSDTSIHCLCDTHFFKRSVMEWGATIKRSKINELSWFDKHFDDKCICEDGDTIYHVADHGRKMILLVPFMVLVLIIVSCIEITEKIKKS